MEDDAWHTAKEWCLLLTCSSSVPPAPAPKYSVGPRRQGLDCPIHCVLPWLAQCLAHSRCLLSDLVS